jgi:hypothetical protein
MELRVNGNILLPREKLTSTPYASMAKDLAGGASVKGNLNVEGYLGVGTTNPQAKLHIVDPNIAFNQPEIIFQAESNQTGMPFQFRMGFHNQNYPSVQGYRINSGPLPLLINPQGGNVSIGGNSPTATLTVYKADIPPEGVVNTLFGAGYSSYYLDGNRSLWIQQWVNSTWARTFIVGNGYLDGSSRPVPHNGPHSLFEALEFQDNFFGFVWNNNSEISPALIVKPQNGNIGIGTAYPSEKLEIDGNLKITGTLKSEQNRPVFFVSVYSDDCGGSHDYLGCPAGYAHKGIWHTGPGRCDGALEGHGMDNGTVDSGWMALCVAQ